MSVVAVSLKKKTEKIPAPLRPEVQRDPDREHHPLDGKGRWFCFSSRRRHTRLTCDWSSDVCSSDLKWMRPADARRERSRRPCRTTEYLLGSSWCHPRSEERRVGKECRYRWSTYQ